MAYSEMEFMGEKNFKRDSNSIFKPELELSFVVRCLNMRGYYVKALNKAKELDLVDQLHLLEELASQILKHIVGRIEGKLSQ